VASGAQRAQHATLACAGTYVLTRIADRGVARHAGLVTAYSVQGARNRCTPIALAGAGAVVFAAATVAGLVLALDAARPVSPAEWAITAFVLAPSVLAGCLVTRAVSDGFVGPALCWVGAAPAVVAVVEWWGDTFLGRHPWPAAEAVWILAQGFWVWNLAGFVALCLVFPDGALAGQLWRRLPLFAVVAACLLNAAVSLDPDTHQVEGVTRAGYALRLPAVLRVAELVGAFGALLAVLVATAASLAVRYRRSGDVARLQLRWLLLSAGAVPVLLTLGWLADLSGAPSGPAYAAFMGVVLVAIPLAVAVAILRHDLYDVDRLLGSSLAWLLTSLFAAALFAATVLVIGEAASASSRVGVTGAAFVTALVLLPLHRLLHERVAGIVDRERAFMLARVDAFVARVRDGEEEPETVVAQLRAALNDPELDLLLRLPGASGGHVDLDGRPARPCGRHRIEMRSGEVELGTLFLGRSSARHLRQARLAVSRARLPIEVMRLRVELRRALAEVSASRARLVAVTTAERRRLERDLHDGAQRQIIAVGMRLRSLQGRFDADPAAYQELDAAVAELETTVTDLRRLAHGVRPSQLGDGLAAALRGFVTGSPIPVELSIADVTLSDVRATTAYFVVAEGLTNALKHACATRLEVNVAQEDRRVVVQVRDDGVGGAIPKFGLTSLGDRVAAAGGTLSVTSPPGGGTRLVAEFACEL
jgi:signal transduction histidine kinase